MKIFFNIGLSITLICEVLGSISRKGTNYLNEALQMKGFVFL